MTIERKPFLGRCKECDYAVFAAAEDIPSGQTYRDVLPGGVCRVRGREFGRCTNGHKFFPLNQIEGTYSEDFKCDSRCLNAKARKCTCSCGGMNHGRGHAVQAVPAQVLTGHARYREEAADRDPLGERMLQNREIEQRERTEEQAEEIQFIKQHLGDEGEKIYFEAKLIRQIESDHSTLYVFMTEVRAPITGELLGLAEIKWWKPDFVDDPGFGAGEVYKLKAKVKRLDDDPKWGKSTIVTYLEEIDS